MGAKRPDIDWVAVQALYLADHLSTRQIAKRYGISDVAILARAKREGWTKDLGRRVATGVKEEVIRASLADGPAKQRRAKDKSAKQAEIIKSAIEEGKITVLRHIADGRLVAGNGKKLAEIIRAKIDAILEKGAEKADEGVLFTLTRAHESVVRALSNTVAIERQARGLDDLPADPTAPPSISITYYRQDLVLPGGQGVGLHQAPAIEVSTNGGEQ